MFAKPPSALAGPPGRVVRFGWRLPDRAALMALATRPVTAAVAAALLFTGAATLLVVVAGDPRAGAPEIRVALHRPKPVASVDPNAAAKAFTVDTLGMYQDLAAPGFNPADAPPITGAAVITLPAGADAGASSPRPALPPRRGPAQPLPAAPMAGLTQQGPGGPLPVISGERSAFSAYARPFHSDGRPKVALIVGGLGLNPASTRAAIERLPPEITLSFVPYAQGLQGWIDLARANGHEVMLDLPMEPTDYPQNDPGPYTLLSSAAPAETLRRLDWLLSRATGYFAVTNYLGARFMTSEPGMGAVLGELRTRGVGFVDDGSARRFAGAFARGSADAVVDDQLSADAIASQLTSLEQTARVKGGALGTGFAYPITVEIAARWADGLKARGLQLAPASALTHR